jgi:hypothetical protein
LPPRVTLDERRLLRNLLLPVSNVAHYQFPS